MILIEENAAWPASKPRLDSSRWISLAMPNSRLLVIDDEPEIATLVSDVAESCKYDVKIAANATMFRALLDDWQPSHIVLDLQMPEMDGVEIIRHLAATNSTAKIILISGFDVRVLASARRLGSARGLSIVGALMKPLRVAELRALFNGARADG